MSNIVKTPGTCGGRARIAHTRIPVWLVVLWHEKHGCTVEDITNTYPYVTEAVIAEALEYAKANRPEINQDILDQEEEQDWW